MLIKSTLKALTAIFLLFFVAFAALSQNRSPLTKEDLRQRREELKRTTLLRKLTANEVILLSNKRKHTSWNSLHEAIYTQKIDDVVYILLNKTDSIYWNSLISVRVEIPQDGALYLSYLGMAVFKLHPEMVDVLLESGADPSYPILMNGKLTPPIALLALTIDVFRRKEKDTAGIEQIMLSLISAGGDVGRSKAFFYKNAVDGFPYGAEEKQQQKRCISIISEYTSLAKG